MHYGSSCRSPSLFCWCVKSWSLSTQLVKSISGLFSVGNYVDVKLQLDLTLQKILSAAGEVMIYFLMSNSRKELLRVTRGEEEEFAEEYVPFWWKWSSLKLEVILLLIPPVCIQQNLIKIISFWHRLMSQRWQGGTASPGWSGSRAEAERANSAIQFSPPSFLPL